MSSMGRPPGGGHDPRQPGTGKDSFGDFSATSLYCPRCRQAVPVRSRLLLILPEGDQYEYLCARCGESVGTKIDHSAEPARLVY